MSKNSGILDGRRCWVQRSIPQFIELETMCEMDLECTWEFVFGFLKTSNMLVQNLELFPGAFFDALLASVKEN